jgi:hypothetical protein
MEDSNIYSMKGVHVSHMLHLEVPLLSISGSSYGLSICITISLCMIEMLLISSDFVGPTFRFATSCK